MRFLRVKVTGLCPAVLTERFAEPVLATAVLALALAPAGIGRPARTAVASSQPTAAMSWPGISPAGAASGSRAGGVLDVIVLFHIEDTPGTSAGQWCLSAPQSAGP